jgi:hypothetical protein
MNESDIKIKMLKEDNDDLTRELRVKNRSLLDSQEQVDRLRKEKSEWRELYLNAAPAKRSAKSTHAHPSGDKRSRKEQRPSPERQSLSGGRSVSNHRGGSRWDVKRVLPDGEALSHRRMSEIVVDLWRQQCRKLNRYVPDKPQSGPEAPYPLGFNHTTNISFLLTAANNFKRVTEHMTTWDKKTNFEHPGYEQAIKKNNVPTHKATYQEITDYPEMALTHKCSPLSHYYISIVQDSPGYKARPSASGETVSNKRDPLHPLPDPLKPLHETQEQYQVAATSRMGRGLPKRSTHIGLPFVISSFLIPKT